MYFTVRNAHGNICRSGEFPKNKCVVSFQAWKRIFINCMGILPLVSCNKTIGKYFREKKDIYGKFTGKY
jgi:hypothetical protein